MPPCQEVIIIRKVELSVDEQIKYETIKDLVDQEGNKQRAALKLDVTVRHINRLIQAYKKYGKSAFVHGNRGRKPTITTSEDIRASVVDLYRTKYYEANFTHYTELLASEEGIKLSVSTVTSILETAGLYSPKLTKPKKKRIQKELRDRQKEARTKKEEESIQANLVAVEDAHSRRPRCANFGELEQMDASPHEWFGTEKTTLHIAVDDATGSITGAWIDKEETLSGYYHVLHKILTDYGIPYRFFTDRRTVFTYKQKASSRIEEDTFTQFSYACKQLGIDIKTSSVPQAKGRVERMFETLQSRLPVELRLKGVTTLDEANEFLNSYIKEFNAKLALPIHSSSSVFEKQPDTEKINLILAVLTERQVDSGHCIRFQGRYYRMINQAGFQVHYYKGTKAMVIRAFDGNLYCTVNDKNVYELEEIPVREEKSKEFSSDYQKPSIRKRSIPAMNHPWRSQSFWRYVHAQKHHWKDPIVEAEWR